MRNEPRKLIASDLDGTFLSHDGSITLKNIEVVKSIKDAELNLLFITGRPARWLSPIATRIGYTGLIIGGNGSFLADMAEHVVLTADEIPTEAAAEAFNRILEKFPNTGFSVERSFAGMKIPEHHALDYVSLKEIRYDDLQVAVSVGYEERWTKELQVPAFEIQDLVALGHITKFIAKPNDVSAWNPDDWYYEIGALVSDVINVNHAAQDYPLAEMSALGVDKGTALAKHAAGLGLTSNDVAAIGDMPNDIPMVKWAREGWAVSDAHADLKEVADFVSDENSDSPVADLILELLQR